MTSKLITAPVGLPVSLALAKSNLGYESSDTEIDALLTAWLMGIAGYAEMQMGRAILNQTWRVTLSRFPSEIRLPMMPVASIDFVKYFDAQNIERTLPAEAYYLDDNEPCHVRPTPGFAWPVTICRSNAVAVQYQCGYGANAEATPAEIQLFMLAKLKEQFDPLVKPEKETIQSSFLDRLLDRFVTYRL